MRYSCLIKRVELKFSFYFWMPQTNLNIRNIMFKKWDQLTQNVFMTELICFKILGVLSLLDFNIGVMSLGVLSKGNPKGLSTFYKMQFRIDPTNTIHQVECFTRLSEEILCPLIFREVYPINLGWVGWWLNNQKNTIEIYNLRNVSIFWTYKPEVGRVVT